MSQILENENLWEWSLGQNESSNETDLFSENLANPCSTTKPIAPYFRRHPTSSDNEGEYIHGESFWSIFNLGIRWISIFR